MFCDYCNLYSFLDRMFVENESIICLFCYKSLHGTEGMLCADTWCYNYGNLDTDNYCYLCVEKKKQHKFPMFIQVSFGIKLVTINENDRSSFIKIIQDSFISVQDVAVLILDYINFSMQDLSKISTYGCIIRRKEFPKIGKLLYNLQWTIQKLKFTYKENKTDKIPNVKIIPGRHIYLINSSTS